MWRREAGFLGSYWLLLLFFLSTQHGAAKEICAPPVDAWSIFNVWSEGEEAADLTPSLPPSLHIPPSLRS